MAGQSQKYDVAEKTVITVLTASGMREEPLDDARRTSQVLNEAQVSELVNWARRIESLYGSPQDIEWCHVTSPSLSGRGARGDGNFYIVQSRPITALPEPEIPAPTQWKLPGGAYAAMRNNIAELMADPLSPLFATLGRKAINNSLHRIMNDSFAMGGIMPPEIIIVVNQYDYKWFDQCEEH